MCSCTRLFYSEHRWWDRLQPTEKREHWRSDPGDTGSVWTTWWRRCIHQHQVHGSHIWILSPQVTLMLVFHVWTTVTHMHITENVQWHLCNYIQRCAHAHNYNPRAMEVGRVRTERRSRSPQPRTELNKPLSTVEEVIKEPQYVVDREKVRIGRRAFPNRAHRLTPRTTVFVLSLLVFTMFHFIFHHPFLSTDMSYAASCIL